MKAPVLLLSLIAIGSAHAELLTYTSYNVTLDPGIPDVTNLMMFENSASGTSATWAFTAFGNGSTLLQNPFVHNDQILTSLLIGETQGLATDPDPTQKHIVLFMDPTTAAASENIDWGTLFPNTDEAQLIAALELATSGQDWSIIQPGLDAVFTFTGGDAQNIPGGLGPVSAWFATGGSFTAMAFSEGVTVGSGVSTVSLTPEPGTAAMLLGALAIIAILSKRRWISRRN
jgi:hypothetical protein